MVCTTLRIAYLIGIVNTGGSERQLCELAAGMRRRGHTVSIAAYDGPGNLDDWVTARGVHVRHGTGGSRIAKIRWIREWIQEYQPHIMHGFMKRASSLAILATLPTCRIPVVGSDLSTATYSRRQPALWGALLLFAFARRVATQTERNRRSLERLAPWLRGKVTIVRNGCDTDRFTPRSGERPPGPFRFLCSGTVYRVKNPVRVVEAARQLRDDGLAFTLDWAGSPGQGMDPSAEYQEAQTLIGRYGLERTVRFLGRQESMESVYPRYDALVHVSLQEGIPNAVVEAMSCGLPVVVSRVSDLPLIVAEGRSGWACDETDPAAIAAAMRRLLELDIDERRAMGERSRELALRWFGRGRLLDEYENLYRQVLNGSQS